MKPGRPGWEPAGNGEEENEIVDARGEVAAAVGLTGRETFNSFMGWVKLIFKYLFCIALQH
jgi:hypothetical protein